MGLFSKADLEEAVRQLSSLIGKSEKVLPKLDEGSSQYTLTQRRIKAYRLSIALIEEKLNEIRAKLYPIILCDYKPEWKDWYEEEKAFIEKRIGKEKIISITHIGSTAVPGMISKPTIDILVEIDEGLELQKLRSVFPKTQYICLNNQTIPSKDIMLFMKGYLDSGFAEKVFHIHIRYKGDWDEIVFRDYLRANSQAAKEYAELKTTLKEKFMYDRDAYTSGKGDFIAAAVKIARAN